MARYAEDKLIEICSAIDLTIGRPLERKGLLSDSQNYDELTEGMNDDRVIQIYPESEGSVDGSSGATQKLTLGDEDGAVIQEEITIHLDYYCRQRSNLADDMGQLLPGIDAIRAKLKEQDCDPFDIPNCQSFQWSWFRTVFVYGQPEIKYIGARFVLVLRFY